jgi:hypothetical protein
VRLLLARLSQARRAAAGCLQLLFRLMLRLSRRRELGGRLGRTLVGGMPLRQLIPQHHLELAHLGRCRCQLRFGLLTLRSQLLLPLLAGLTCTRLQILTREGAASSRWGSSL